MGHDMTRKNIKKCIFVIAVLTALMETACFAGIEASNIPQYYNVDNFEDSLLTNNYVITTLYSDNDNPPDGPLYFYSSWGPELEVSNVTDPDDPGNKCINVEWDVTQPNQYWYSCTWDGIDQDTILDASYYTHLVFRVKGTLGNEDFYIQLQDQTNDFEMANITYFVENVTTEWQDIYIPLRYFRGNDGGTAVDLTKIKAVAFVFYSDNPDDPGDDTGSVYIDDIRFVGCVIDDFSDNLPGENTLRLATGAGGNMIVENLDTDGCHKLSWISPDPNDVPYWHTTAGFYSDLSGTDPVYYNYLYFKIKGAGGGENFRIDYHTYYNHVTVDSRDCLTVTTAWKEVYIPVKLFTDQGVSRTDFNALAFRFGGAGYTASGTIYIDDVELRYIEHPPVITTGDKTMYKNYTGGFHIKTFDADGDPIASNAYNLPPGSALDNNTGFILWKPAATGAYPVVLEVKEKRRGAQYVQKPITINVLDPAGIIFAKPQSTGSVKIEGRELFVEGRKYTIQGVGYQPVPIGQDAGPEAPWRTNSDIFNRDFTLLSSIGVNTIRTWGEPGAELLTAAQDHGIKVCAGYWVDVYKNPANPSHRAEIKNGFHLFVERLKGYPAVLMWSIGNENNYFPIQNKKEWYSLINEMAKDAYENVEGASYHPVAVVNGAFGNISDMDMFADDASMPYLDVWGSNLYPGYSFGTALNDFTNLSDKPLWISEYGIDAYQTTAWHYDNGSYISDSGYLDEDLQEEWDANGTIEVMASRNTIGGTIMAYSDEWWKADGTSVHNEDGLPLTPENGFSLQPDNFANEEYWGIVSIAPDGADGDTLDDITPRPVFYKLGEIFGNMPFSVVRPGDSIQPFISDPATENFVYIEEGSYGDGAAIDISGDKTLKAVGDVSDTVLNSNVLFRDSHGKLDSIKILYPKGSYLTFQNEAYPDGLAIFNDAGVTAINSSVEIRNCIIEPDLETMDPQPDRYGKGIQIFNLYDNPDISPYIGNNLIQNAGVGIFEYSQASGGGVTGVVEDNTLHNNTYGIVERMHGENPVIKNNIITNSSDAIHLSYQDGNLLDARSDNIMDNDLYGNARNVWCDEAQLEVTPAGAGNISEDPLYSSPPADYSPLNPHCADKGCRLW